jgi:ectoine hydroxylase-related dioxygenase (phytanoyl-CoA dioxygenase family)
LHITDEEHTKIINAMPWKKTESPEIREFAEYMEHRVSEILERRVKIFNDDIWVRICRPSSVTDTDYNPCHRDIYLDFYRNIANIYVPIVGSNELSSLAMQSGSHYWNERDIVVTKGGAFFPKTGKKYSVDAVLKSRQPLNMTRPNPREDEFILFSPYLIHGCSSNGNVDMTRMSAEIRFIEDTDAGRKQESDFREFLAKRVWR